MKKEKPDNPRPQVKAILLMGAILIAATAIIRFLPACMCGHLFSHGQHGADIASLVLLKQLEAAVQSYELDQHELPSSLEDLTKVINTNGPYIMKRELIDAWGQKFEYTKDKSHNKGFVISTTSPDGKIFSNKNEGWDSLP